MSEAGTEIHDNRTSAARRFVTQPFSQLESESRSQRLHQRQSPPSPDDSSRNNDNESNLTSSNYGFFPSTKPPALASPSPTSPPRVTRRQLPTDPKSFIPQSDDKVPISQAGRSRIDDETVGKTSFSVEAQSAAGTSVVPETGAFEIPLEEVAGHGGGGIEDTARFRLQKKQGIDDGEEAGHGDNPDYSKATATATAAMTQQSLQQLDREQQRQPAHHNFTLNRRTTTRERRGTTLPLMSDNTFGLESRDLSLISEKENEDATSEVFSTSSEMGTIINVGSARMAEIDAMTALVESSPSITQEGSGVEMRGSNNGEAVPLSSLSENGLDDLGSGLSLPVLEADLVAHPVKFPQSRKLILAKHDNTASIENGTIGSELNSSGADMCSGTLLGRESLQRSLTSDGPPASTSAMVTAAIRRIGSGLNHNHNHPQYSFHGNNKTLSAPPTPKTPGVPPPPRVEDLLKSTLTPRVNSFDGGSYLALPQSFALRSPGSSAHHKLQGQKALLTPRFSPSPASTDHKAFLSTGGQQREGAQGAATQTESEGGDLSHMPLQDWNNNDKNSQTSRDTPRCGTHTPGRAVGSEQQQNDDDKNSVSPSISTSMIFPSSFQQVAQKCFSFDSSLDQFPESEHYSSTTRPLDMRQKVSTFRSRDRFTRAADRMPQKTTVSNPYRRLLQSKSWDVSSSTSATAFRYSHHSRWIRGRRRILGDSASTPAQSGSNQLQHHHLESGTAASDPASARTRIHSDFSPTKHSKVLQELQVPQRIEIEREDALDILACLVERGAVGWGDGSTGTGSPSPVASTPSFLGGQGDEERKEGVADTSAKDMDTWIAEMAQTIRSKTHDKDESTYTEAKRERTGDQYHIIALDELLKSRSYALEMKRASLSASAWLKSIGRSGSMAVDSSHMTEIDAPHTTAATTNNIDDDCDHDMARHPARIPTTNTSSFGPISAAADEGKHPPSNKSNWEGRSSIDSKDTAGASDNAALHTKMDLITLRATLHGVQAELAEKLEANRTLNEELSKCRAEIGRLRSSARTELHTTPNRSILDDSHDEPDTSSSSTSSSTRMKNDVRDIKGISGQKMPSPIARQFSHELAEDMKSAPTALHAGASFDGNTSAFILGISDGEEMQIEREAHGIDVLAMKSALERANETITRLHKEVYKKQEKLDSEVHVDRREEQTPGPPIVDIPALTAGSSLRDRQHDRHDKSHASTANSKSFSPSQAEHRTVNVRMLDGENFVTEWDDLIPPLPPPPDHGLRSPIVNTVLEQWTSDRSLHDSLLSWMDRVMTSYDLESTVPPLTISSLDHQVRDGFTMHVLPLLLRRADIHVEVQTRAHRRTTYDMAVTVNQKAQAGSRQFYDAHIPIKKSSSSSSTTAISEHSTSQVPASASLLDAHIDEWEQKFEPKVPPPGSVTHSAATEQVVNSGNAAPKLRELSSATPFRQRNSSSAHFDNEYTSFNFLPHSASAGTDFDDPAIAAPAANVAANSSAVKPQQQQGIMSAIEGALGGLLSRRKHGIPNSPSREECNGADIPLVGGSPTHAVPATGFRTTVPPPQQQHLGDVSSPAVSSSSAFFRAAVSGMVGVAGGKQPGIDSSADADADDQPYHRVVSSPPGRIGVTFVEFRGHAMVSDVAPDSPLSGWVFPSDILIAIDEVPVSGMRVRDIIKVLTTRRNRHRALRVISSHAMNEFTYNASPFSEDDAGH